MLCSFSEAGREIDDDAVLRQLAAGGNVGAVDVHLGQGRAVLEDVDVADVVVIVKPYFMKFIFLQMQMIYLDWLL